MRSSTPAPTLLVTALALTALPLAAQDSSSSMMQHHPSVTTDLVQDLATVRQKLVSLGEAIPEETWSWRPGEGVRSATEVYMHVASDNYLLPTALGVAPPASTGIDPSDYATVQAFERRDVTKAEAIQQLQDSFDHLVAAMQGTSQEDLGKELSIFGQQMTGQALWVMATTHVHEHLGQMIAYARTNGVVPPWSR